MPESELPRIGFVGLGNMGRPMVARIAAAGYRVVVFDIDARAVARVVAGDAVRSAAGLAQVGRESDIVIAMLPTGAIVAQAVLGADGLVTGLAPGTLVIDMSSSFPIGTQQLGGVLGKLGIGTLDAPVSGGVQRAERGTLAIMAGGDPDSIDRANPLFETMGKVYRTGALGSGHALKALNNFVSAAGLAASCEALLIARHFGIDSEIVIDVLNASSGRNNATETKMRQFVTSGSFGSGFTAELMAKDIRTAVDLAHELSLSSPLLEFNSRLWDEAADALGDGADHTHIYRYLEMNSAAPR